ncbi:MAG: A24 family peptidase [Aeromicrobium sp.]|uniref:hypothetical protein n=1 Tax=Aeromicrobium sp. TaxID=1871063 RepID=UPI003C61A7AE
MDPLLLVAVAALAASAVAAVGPAAIAELPEPSEPAGDKISYAQVARLPGIRWQLIIPAAVAAAVVAWRIDVPELVPVWVAVCGIGAWLAYVDWHTRYLPFVLTSLLYLVVLLLVVVAAIWAGDRDIVVHALIGNVTLYLLYRIMYWLARRFFGGAFGYGDVRLSASLGLALGALGYAEVVAGGYGGFLLGGVVAPVLVRLRVIDRDGFAFGPFMLVGAVLGAAFGAAVQSQ